MAIRVKRHLRKGKPIKAYSKQQLKKQIKADLLQRYPRGIPEKESIVGSSPAGCCGTGFEAHLYHSAFLRSKGCPHFVVGDDYAVKENLQPMFGVSPLKQARLSGKIAEGQEFAGGNQPGDMRHKMRVFSSWPSAVDYFAEKEATMREGIIQEKELRNASLREIKKAKGASEKLQKTFAHALKFS